MDAASAAVAGRRDRDRAASIAVTNNRHVIRMAAPMISVHPRIPTASAPIRIHSRVPADSVHIRIRMSVPLAGASMRRIMLDTRLHRIATAIPRAKKWMATAARRMPRATKARCAARSARLTSPHAVPVRRRAREPCAAPGDISMITTASITMQFGAKPLFENISVKWHLLKPKCRVD